LAAGHELVVLSRNPSSVKALCGASVLPLSSLNDWRDNFRIDVVINLAGEPIIRDRWSKQRKEQLWSSRVALTEGLTACIAQLKYKPSVLLSGSGIGIYGDCGDQILDDATVAANDFLGSLCSAWEHAALAARENGVRVCLLRTGLVLHPSGGLLGRLLPAFRRGLGSRLGAGKQWMSWIHLDDFIGLTLHLLKTPVAQGPFNMTAPVPVSHAEFTATLARVLNRPARVSVPDWLLRFALGERASMLLGGQRALPMKAGALGYHFLHSVLEDALSDLIRTG
jgi:uncharacterized protein (TIGR01777 family)